MDSSFISKEFSFVGFCNSNPLLWHDCLAAWLATLSSFFLCSGLSDSPFFFSLERQEMIVLFDIRLLSSNYTLIYKNKCVL